MNHIGVNLAEPAKRHVIRSEGGLEAAAVFENIFLRVPLCETEIQNLFATKIAHAAGTRAEPMDQPGDFGQRSSLEHAQPAHSAFRPALGYGSVPAVGARASFDGVR